MKRLLPCLLLVLLLAGCGRLAPALVLPQADDLTAVQITALDGSVHRLTGSTEIEALLDTLAAAQPTRKESVQDSPLVEPCGQIDLYFAEGAATLFYYEQRDQLYLERPYQGIYLLEADPEALLPG